GRRSPGPHAHDDGSGGRLPVLMGDADPCRGRRRAGRSTVGVACHGRVRSTASAWGTKTFRRLPTKRIGSGSGSRLPPRAEQVEHVPRDLPLLVSRDEPDRDGGPVGTEASGLIRAGGPVAGTVEP